MDITNFSELSSANQIITAVEFFLITLFSLYSFRLIGSWAVDRNQIKKLHKLLSKYKKKIQKDSQNATLDISQRYDELFSEINNSSPKLQKIWKSFDESLFKSVVKDKIVIRKYRDANHFFNKKTMVKNFDSKLFKSTADILLFVGIVGSMIAIYFVLVNLDDNAVIKIQTAFKTINDTLILIFSKFSLNEYDITQLIDSFTLLIKVIGVKLWVAILAIILAVIFSYKHKFLQKWLEKNLVDVQQLVDEMFIKKTENKK